MSGFKNIDKLLSIFDNYQGQTDKVFSCFEIDNYDELALNVLSLINYFIKEDLALDNKQAICNMVSFVKEELENNNSINRVEINRKVRKILESINFFLMDENFVKYTKKEYRSFYHFFVRDIMKLPIEINENDKYLDIIWIVIKEIKNLDYLEKSLEVFEIKNCKNKDNNSFIMELINIYINYIKEDNINEVKYYSLVIKLVLEKSDLTISEEEQELCIEKLKEAKTYFGNPQNPLKNLLLDDVIESFQCSFDNANVIRDLSMRYGVIISDSGLILPDTIIDKRLSSKVLSNDYIISIDNPRTREVDDALSCKKLDNGNYLLGIHIADVFGYIGIDNPIIDSALERTETIYLKNLCIPMLPNQFITKYGSLLENKERYADSHYYEISPDGKIVSDIIMPSIVFNSKKTNYEYINNYVLKGKTSNKDFDETLNNLIEVEQILENKTFVEYRGEGEIETPIFSDSIAEKIIIYTMLLENTNQANYFHKNGYPFIYRTDNSPCAEKLKKDLGLPNEISDINIQRFIKEIDKDRQRVVYGMEGTVSDLVFEHYTHSTSPLRRFADLWNRYLINEIRYNNRGNLDELYEKTLQIVDVINKRVEDISHFTSEYNKYVGKIKTKK